MRLFHTQQRRQGFTLVEMMVAMALTVFILVILSQAFGTGMDTFRQLKAIGDMQEGLRTAALRLRADLGYDHFEGKRRLSDPNFWDTNTWGNPARPGMGFFYVRQVTALSAVAGSPYFDEGLDLDGIGSARATNHRLWFTIKLHGNRKEDFVSASVPKAPPPTLFAPTPPFLAPFSPDTLFTDPVNGVFTSQWAEVAYYLVKTGSTVEPNVPAAKTGTFLYTLYRAQRVVVPDNTGLNIPQTATSATDYGQVSCSIPALPNPVYFNTPMDLATNKGAIVFQPPPSFSIPPPNPNEPSASPLLTNVVSFQVRILQVGGTDFIDVPGGRIFDTTAAPGYTIAAIQITLRVWDVKTQQSRQITVIQDL